MNISISEINSYLTCRRAWDISSANRQSLKHKSTPKMFFVVGSGVHEAIDAQARGDDPFACFEEFLSRERTDREMAYQGIVGSPPWQSEMEEFDSAGNLARSLVRQYFDHYTAENPLADYGLEYVATEIPFSIGLPGDLGSFVGTFDAVATDSATHSLFYLVENKTAAQKPKLENIQSANQFVGYNWAFRALTGVLPAGTLYNGILKRLIKPPKHLVSGALSQDKQASVTLASFLAELQRGGHEPVKYLKYMEYLEERERNGDDRFFIRNMFHYSNYQLDQWYSNVLEPMAYELATDPYPIPNFGACDMCLVRDICTAMQIGEDVDAIINARYEVKTYGTMEAVQGITPTEVGSADELVALLKRD